MGDRTYDIVLLGATGFTGHLTARYLAGELEGTGLSWAIAGRNVARLEAIRQEVALLGVEPAVEIADSHDLVSLLALAEQTRVLVTTVGPYAQHGELTVQACARMGTDYLDITGEPNFVDLALNRYDGDARANGARIVNACGLDSIPADLGTRLTVSHLPADAPMTVRAFLRLSGQPSGGTWNSLLGVLGTQRLGALLPKPRRDGTRVAAMLPLRPTRVQQVGGYGLPAPVLDADVVLRSARALPAYGPDFHYGHYLHVRRPWTAAGVAAGAGALFVGARVPPVRSLLGRLRPAGEGPDDAAREQAWFQITFVGDAAGHRVITSVSGDDPGYGGTARMLGQAALSMAQDDLPATAGVVTTAEAFEGGHLLKRLEADGALTFEVLEG